jgi:hypothetical protein
MLIAEPFAADGERLSMKSFRADVIARPTNYIGQVVQASCHF